MLHLQRGHGGRHIVVIGGRAVEVLAVDACCRIQKGAAACIACSVGRGVAGQADGGDAAVGHIALLDVQQVHEHAGGRVQAEGKRGRNAPAVVLDAVAARHIGVLRHGVQAHGRAGLGIDDAIQVDAGALVACRTQAQRAAEAVVQIGLLAHQVDSAGGGAAAVVGAGRALGDFDLIDVEHVARDRADVAHAVHIDAAGAVEATHIDGVARAGVAVLACVEGAGAGHIAQRLCQRGRALLLQQLLLDDVDGLRGVDQRLGELGRRQLAGRVAGVGLAFHLDLLERGFGGLGLRRQCQRGTGQHGGAGDQTGGGGQATRRMLAALDIDVGLSHVERTGSEDSWLAGTGCLHL